MGENILIVHGGGPTSVINASLYGAVKEAKKYKEIEHIYAAKNGPGGLMREELIELENVPDEKLELLLNTPGSAIGTSRDQIEQAEYDRMIEVLLKKNIKYVLFNGGNGSMDTCGKLYKNCQARGLDIRVMGIPKTHDNDIAITDHSPGYGSIARYMAQSVKEVAADVKGLPIHVVVVEALGRNAGWTTAASALADDGDGVGPDLIYLPERPFDEEKFLDDVKKLLEKKSGIVVVASEGLRDKDGKPIVEPIFQVGRATYFGDVSQHLANLVIKKLGYKARGEKPGLVGRAAAHEQSPVDREEAQRKRMEQEKNKLDMLMKKAKIEQRKADNHRKIVVGANFETFLNEPRRYSEEQTRRIMQVAFATREVKNCMEKIEREIARAEEKMPDTAINEEADEGESEEE